MKTYIKIEKDNLFSTPFKKDEWAELVKEEGDFYLVNHSTGAPYLIPKHLFENPTFMGKLDAQDLVNRPARYTFSKIEVIEALEAWKLDFRLSNAVKYLARAGKKNKEKTKEDLEKAIWYINRYIQKELT